MDKWKELKKYLETEVNALEGAPGAYVITKKGTLEQVLREIDWLEMQEKNQKIRKNMIKYGIIK